ncbi:Protein transport protein SEC31 [Golovinomyces cichoracearum]|uniref:Protein transport protein SEC31 n=1 Tax=Golovinomyces cichoracearum TaxID=62708 RepID=A0A420I7Z1_9PEZI|nr:Protein transport protein SEC31 [Golovinomyces cichoracearum]
MARLRTIARTGAFSWNPDPGLPLLVTGTRAGAVDSEFSDETKLELWNLSLDNPDQSVELQAIASYSTDSRFYDLAWSHPNTDHPRGIIAGALENGSLYLWDAEKFINHADDALISQTKKHTGPIKSLQFNPLKPQILATAGVKGELFIYDINDISNPFRLGTTAASSDDLECIVWNRKVPHILATGGTGGFVTVWDLKTKKASLTLNNNRKAIGAIAWDPDNATKLLTATPDNTTPVILLWDLRNSNAPESTLQGHSQGILSISWCQQDNNLLLSCGKDNRTILWDPQAGELLGEFPEATNWTFQTRFHPHNPTLSATASFDGKISIHTLYNTNTTAAQPQAQNAIDGEDFFAKVQNQPQALSFSLKKAPKWFERPSGVSFGFGGKLVSFSQLPKNASHQRSSKIQISNYSVDSKIESAMREFEEALQSGDLKKICQDHILQSTSDEEKANWKVMETLTAEDSRKNIVEHLEFQSTESEDNFEVNFDEVKSETSTKSNADVEISKKRLSTLFADGPDGEDFLSDVSATKGAKTDHPFHLISESDSEAEKQISQALILGQFEKAMGICLKQDRIADAMIIANCGGKSLLEKVQSSYLSKKTEGPNYLRILAAVIGKNLWDIVYNADLANWKEVMVTLCTYADSTEFPDLCETLGDRMMENNSPKDASLCYLVGSKLEKVVPIWLMQLQETEKTEIEKLGEDSLFSIHARTLQKFIEKVTIFRDVTKFKDTEQNLITGWKLSPLYAKYIEYANIAAAHGRMETAEKYLDLLPVGYSTAEVERNRVKLVSKKALPEMKREHQPQQNIPKSQSRFAAVNNFDPKVNSSIDTQTRTNTNPYMPSSSVLAGKSYETSSSIPGNPYAPNTSTSMSHQNLYQPSPEVSSGAERNHGAPQYGAHAQNFMAPGRKSVPPPPPRAKDVGQWNDTPMVVKPPIVRRSTPSLVPNHAQPSIQQQNFSMPQMASQYGGKSVATPPPPPSKLSNKSQLNSPSMSGPPQQFSQRPPSVTNKASYGPPQQFAQRSPLVTNKASYGTATPYVPPASQGPPTPYAPPTYQGPPMSQGSPYNLQPQSESSIVPPSKTIISNSSVKKRYPAGDRSHIPPNAQKIFEILTQDMQRVALQAPTSFMPQVKDTQKRLNILFDHLNNEELIKSDSIQRLNELAEALMSKNYDVASRLQVDIQKEKTEECGNWMVGVKRLISMSKVTP